MSIIYKCRHCGDVIGSLMQQSHSTSELGLDALTEIEQKSMMEHKDNGDVHVKIICESCEESLEQHPNYYELEHFIQ